MMVEFTWLKVKTRETKGKERTNRSGEEVFFFKCDAMDKKGWRNFKSSRHTIPPPHPYTKIIKITLRRPHNGVEIKSHEARVSKRRDAQHRFCGKAELLLS